jgi:hypothetical protein
MTARTLSEHPECVKAQVAFVDEPWRHRPEAPRIYSRQTRLANTSLQDVVIHNARLRREAADLDLDQSGFALVDDPIQIEDARDNSYVRSSYFPHMRHLIRSLTGAHDALDVGFYQVRSSQPEHFFDAFSLYMHCDFGLGDWQGFAKSVLKEHGKDYSFEDWDFACYNLWRPLGEEVQKNPLVLIDASTLAEEDIISYLPFEKGQSPRVSLPLYSENQRLYYVPRMRPDEVLIFKQLESRPGKAVVCPHASFVDPNSPPDAPERTSIDIRFLCVFPKPH